MFGDFFQNFGLNFPFQGADPQGGLFGQNAPAPDQAGLGGPATPTGAGQGQPPISAPAAGTGPASPLANPSPLAPPNSFSPPKPANQPPNVTAPAPAAGVGSLFGQSAL